MILNPKALQNVIFQQLGCLVCLLISLNFGSEKNLIYVRVVSNNLCFLTPIYLSTCISPIKVSDLTGKVLHLSRAGITE